MDIICIRPAPWRTPAARPGSSGCPVLLLAGRRALEAGAFEETLEAFDNLLGLELPEQDPLLGEAYEHRGDALLGLQRYDDAAAAFNRALAIYSANGDDVGIERTARSESNSHLWRGPRMAGLAPLTRGLSALSRSADRERALLLSWLGVGRIMLGLIEESWQAIDEATSIAERLNDTDTLSRVLAGKSYCERLCSEPKASAATAQKSLQLRRGGSLWERADLLLGRILCEFYVGRFAKCDELLPELEAAAGRAGHHGALWVHGRVKHGLELARTGDIRRYLDDSTQALAGATFTYVTRIGVGLSHLLLGAIDQASEQLATVVEEQPADHWLRGLPEASLFVAAALAGRHDRARALIPTVVPWLPVSGRRNTQGSYYALNGLITGVTLLGDREQCGGLSPRDPRPDSHRRGGLDSRHGFL